MEKNAIFTIDFYQMFPMELLTFDLISMISLSRRGWMIFFDIIEIKQQKYKKKNNKTTKIRDIKTKTPEKTTK